MNKQQEVLKLALEALRDYRRSDDDRVSVAMGILQEALAEQPAQQQEPVAWVGSLKDPQPHCVTDLKYCSSAQWDTGYHLKYIPLYTSPPASKPWVGLSTDEIYDMYNEPRSDAEMVEFARAIEAKLKGKNA